FFILGLIFIISIIFKDNHMENTQENNPTPSATNVATAPAPLPSMASTVTTPTSPTVSLHLQAPVPLIPKKEGKIRVDDDAPKPPSAPSASSGLTASPVAPSLTPTRVDVKTTPHTGIQFPALRSALQTHYRQASHLTLPLSEQRFPIKDVSLTISDKS